MDPHDHRDGPPSVTRMRSDAVMWDIERDPVLRSTIAAVALLDPGVEWGGLRDRSDVASRLVPRFRDPVVAAPLRRGPPRRVVDPAFDLDDHLRRVRAPEPGTLRQVLDQAQPIAMQPFDSSRPPRQMTVVDQAVARS